MPNISQVHLAFASGFIMPICVARRLAALGNVIA
jgi:hypothetical protein